MALMEKFTEEYQNALADATAECRKGTQCYGMEDYAEGWKDIENPFDHIEDMDADTLDWVYRKLEEQRDQLEAIMEAISALSTAKERLDDADSYED